MKPSSQASDRSTNEDLEGLAARNMAVRMIKGVLGDMRTFDDVRSLVFSSNANALVSERDRAFARLIAASVLRNRGALDETLSNFIKKPLPSRQLRTYAAILCASAELLILRKPPHAAINSAVSLVRQNRKSSQLAGFTNAVLRRIAREGAQTFNSLDHVRLSVPDWLWQRWQSNYGADLAYKIAEASLREPALDITAKSNADRWQGQLSAQKLTTGSLRLSAGGRVNALPGYEDGEWWVQDAAAALPVRFLGDLAGLNVLELCAAPGGKTAQLAAAGASVTALDIDERRCRRIQENLKRLKLSAEIVVADATDWTSNKTYDAVLLDAPCSATGTLRRHPDIYYLRREADIANSAKLQAALLDKAYQHVNPGGQLVFATCSIEPEEGANQITSFLSRTPQASLIPLQTTQIDHLGLSQNWITPEGYLQTLPFQDPRTLTDQNQGIGTGGMDGFFAARIKRNA